MTSSERLGLIDWYAAQGWSVLPLAPRGKAPVVGANWPAWRCLRADLLAHFGPGRTGAVPNVGIILGAASGGLVDVDLDCPEALRWAPSVLPPTLTFGRASALRSHWLYLLIDEAPPRRAAEDVPPPGKSKGPTLCELRGTGGQTMFPPSIHPSGEEVEWTADADAELAHISSPRLLSLWQTLAGLCLVERHAGRPAAEAWACGGALPVMPARVLLLVRALLGLEPEAANEPARDRAQVISGGWIQALKGCGPSGVARAFDLSEPRPGTFTCPACGADKRGSTDARGPIGLFSGAGAWHCYRCEAKGDALTLASWCVLRTARPEAHAWSELRAECERRGLL